MVLTERAIDGLYNLIKKKNEIASRIDWTEKIELNLDLRAIKTIIHALKTEAKLVGEMEEKNELDKYGGPLTLKEMEGLIKKLTDTYCFYTIVIPSAEG